MGSQPTGAVEALRRRPWVSLLALLMVISTALLIGLRAHIGFYLDDWDLVVVRSGASDWLLPHNEHIIVIPAALYEASLSVFGMTAMPIHLVAVALFETSVLLLFFWLRRLIGEPVAVLGCAVVLFLGSSTANLVWPFQVGYFGSFAGGLGALLLLRRNTATDDAKACLLLVVSLLFSSMFLPFVVAAAVQLLYREGGRPSLNSLRKRAWVFLVPVALFVIWWLGWGHLAKSFISVENALKIPLFNLSALGYSVAALTGLFPLREITMSFVWAIPGLIVAAGFAFGLHRRRRVPPEFLLAAAAALVFWTLACLNFVPGRDFVASRYQYPSVVFLLMMLAGACSGLRPGRQLFRGLAALTVVAVAINAAALIYIFNHTYKVYEGRNLSGMTALDISRGTVVPGFGIAIGTDGAGAHIDADTYFNAVDRYGSPGWDDEEIEAASEADRSRIDTILVGALRVRLIPAKRVSPLPRTCRIAEATEAIGDPVTVTSPVLLIEPEKTVGIYLGRFGPDASAPAWGAVGGVPTGYLIPSGRSDRPWRIGFKGEGKVRVCEARLAPETGDPEK